MEQKQISADIGVIVGRFQVHELHEGHKELINYVVNRHNKVIVFLGTSNCFGTSSNPLDIPSRQLMFSESFPNVFTSYIVDQRYNKDWSDILDQKINELKTPAQSVVLYGSRDSFIPHYEGKYPTIELVPEKDQKNWSGTEIREKIKSTVEPSKDFRAGVIYQSANNYPRVIPTVDIACLNEDETKVLMIKKINENKWRFPGGFAETKSDSYEIDAIRELQEETGVTGDDLTYLGSYNINDWRYRSEKDKIRTCFYSCKYIFGPVKSGDDASHAEFVDINSLDEVIEEHTELLDVLKEHLCF